jgi:hypothetical protein
MEYGVWNRDYDLYINGTDHLVAKRKLIQPRTHERERNTKKQTEKQPSRRRALQVNSPPDKTSLYAPKKQKHTKIWRQRKTGSSVFVVSRFIAHTHEVLGSFSDSDVSAFIVIIRTAIVEQNLLRDHVVAIKHGGKDTSFLRHATIAPSGGNGLLILGSEGGTDNDVLHIIECKCVTSIDVSKKFLISLLVARCVREVEAH